MFTPPRNFDSTPKRKRLSTPKMNTTLTPNTKQTLPPPGGVGILEAFWLMAMTSGRQLRPDRRKRPSKPNPFYETAARNTKPFATRPQPGKVRPFDYDPGENARPGHRKPKNKADVILRNRRAQYRTISTKRPKLNAQFWKYGISPVVADEGDRNALRVFDGNPSEVSRFDPY